MFLTTDAYKLNVPEFLTHQDESHWKFVCLSQNKPWFVAKVLIGDLLDETGQTETHRTLLISDFEDLEKLSIFINDKAVSVESVQIVTPDYMNRTSSWKMHALVAVWVGCEPNHPSQAALVFETLEGETFCLSGLGTRPEDLLHKEMKASFKVPMSRNR